MSRHQTFNSSRGVNMWRCQELSVENNEMCFINAIFIITVNRSSTRVGSVVISNGAYLIVVAIAVLIEQ